MQPLEAAAKHATQGIQRFRRERTQATYPDGETIDLFFTEVDGLTRISDLGETIRWLRTNAVSETFHLREHLATIKWICLYHGVQFTPDCLLEIDCKDSATVEHGWDCLVHCAQQVAKLYTLKT